MASSTARCVCKETRVERGTTSCPVSCWYDLRHYAPIGQLGRPERRKGSMFELPGKGRCQCGECRFTVGAKPFVSYTCHCTECQRLTATAFLSCMQVAAEHVVITQGTPSVHQRIADSGSALDTWFCPTCGSTLFAQNSARPRVRTVHIGAMERPEAVEVTAHIWVSRKLPWVILPDGHRIYDGPGDWTEDYRNDITRYKPGSVSP